MPKVKITQSSNSFYTPSTNASGNYVGYSKVIENIVSKNDENNTNGSIESYYENNIDEGIFDTTADNLWSTNGTLIQVGLPSREPNLPSNGNLIKQVIKDKSGIEKEKIINTYNSKIRNFYKTGVKLGPLVSSASNGNGTYLKYYLIGFYPIRGIDSYLTKTENITYENGVSLITKTEFTYNDYLQLKKKELTNSDGSILNESFTYQVDTYASNPPLGLISKLYSNQIEKNGSISKRVNYFYNNENLIKISNTLGMIGINSTNTGSPNFYTEDKLFTYDLNSNIIEFKNNPSTGLITKYIWDYYGKYPIMKIEGYGNAGWPSASLINNVVNATQDYNNISNLSSSILTLRNSVGYNISVTSYIHKNLGGVTSITDPRGETIYYEYDTFNRLLHIKDKDGNIINKNEYNYKN